MQKDERVIMGQTLGEKAWDKRVKSRVKTLINEHTGKVEEQQSSEVGRFDFMSNVSVWIM